LSGLSPLTCLAWEALSVAYATASIALGIMWPHKPPPPLRQSRDTFGGNFLHRRSKYIQISYFMKSI
jgi:hypothetical protein